MDCCKGRFARCGDIVTEGRETAVICRAQLINWNVFCCQYDHISNLCRCLHFRIYYINDSQKDFLIVMNMLLNNAENPSLNL